MTSRRTTSAASGTQAKTASPLTRHQPSEAQRSRRQALRKRHPRGERRQLPEPIDPGCLYGLNMTTSLVYEVTVSVDRAILDEFDAWLEQHIREMLELPGFISAETFESEAGSPDRVGRIVHYVLESDDALEEYLAGPAEEMRRAGALRFGDRLEASRRVLRPAHAPERASSPEFCLNCQARLQGQYCARCGQRARGRLISIWELVRDAVGDLFELDSRLWQTIIPLMLRPGQLTHDYLVGRRARFMPPF